MIPHHEAAVKMATDEILGGKDPEIRALAKGIFAGQRKEIALMKKWLEENAPDAEPASDTGAM